MSTFSPAYPFTAALCVGGGYPLKIVCHNRVVGLPHDVTARLVMILLTCLPKAVKGYRTAGSVGGQAELRYSPPFADCVAECDRWFGVGSGPAEVTTIAEPLHRAPGETTRLSEGGSGGSDTAQGTTISESSRPINGETARLSGVAPSQSAVEAEASPRAHGEPVRLMSGVGKPGLTSVSVAHPGDGLASGTGGRGGSPGNGAPDRARLDRPAVDRLAEQSDAGGAVTRRRRPGCGAAWLQSGPAVAPPAPPRGG